MFIRKKIIFFLLILSGLTLAFVIFDYGYLTANLRYDFSPPRRAVIQTALAYPLPANTISIPTLGVKAPIVYAGDNSEAHFQQGLENGVVHYPQTADPGQFGNCYLFGHSSDYLWKPGGYKNVFAVLPKIQKGAQIMVTDSAGQQFIYTVTDSFKTAANDFSVLNQKNFQKKLLTLQTSYPVGTALARWIVVAELNS